MVRRLIDDFREFPATMVLCSLWVIVFALMVLDQTAQGHAPTWTNSSSACGVVTRLAS